ncbi:DUF4342 domain-containing protein [Spirochaeta africana]|uniref:DUF4342 domain-containing protein n=1 Tax=Spirochaeta africana (strain ATCC 700263 / DSM 8902 / Z-7692) TaxID=889378 RepID=H9UM44_SPIAZ|nr:DUF4342 domain-containing protein [Spirochaeta africana]AFG38587.1 hypothetical protein Spiaf_2557 [Spirochaeta africana DSM 8902]
METWTEKFQVAGNRVVDRVKQLVKEGNVRRIIIRKPDGEVLKEITLTAGVAVSGLAFMLVPWLAALGALVAMGMNYTIEVERSGSPDDFDHDDDEPTGAQ